MLRSVHGKRSLQLPAPGRLLLGDPPRHVRAVHGKTTQRTLLQRSVMKIKDKYCK